jgi:hypothetical protein
MFLFPILMAHYANLEPDFCIMTTALSAVKTTIDGNKAIPKLEPDMEQGEAG